MPSKSSSRSSTPSTGIRARSTTSSRGSRPARTASPNTPHYWFLWNLFAEQVKRAKWLAHLDREHPHGSEVLSTIFLTAWWKDNVRHWRSLEGYAHNVDALFDALPPVWIVLDSYVRFLYHIGERSMPAAFVRIANALRRGNPADMLRESNTVFMLEVLLQRHVYARPLELKREDRTGCIAAPETTDAVDLWTVGFADSHLCAARNPVDGPWKTLRVSHRPPTGRWLPTSSTAYPQRSYIFMIREDTR
jgi:hypothetical protein